jgi:hypothetical protein
MSVVQFTPLGLLYVYLVNPASSGEDPGVEVALRDSHKCQVRVWVRHGSVVLHSISPAQLTYPLLVLQLK